MKPTFRHDGRKFWCESDDHTPAGDPIRLNGSGYSRKEAYERWKRHRDWIMRGGRTLAEFNAENSNPSPKD